MPEETAVPNQSPALHQVSVRRLVEFILQSGDITPGDFQRRDRAQLGTQGHRRVQRSRPEGYAAEVEISCLVVQSDLSLEVRGRMDGLYADAWPPILEEIKTTTLSLALLYEEQYPLHWAQAQCYASMLARQNDLPSVCIHLTYYHLDSREERTFKRIYSRAALETFFEDLVSRYLAWYRKYSAWLYQRDDSIARVEFPYGSYRQGQREMAVAIYKSIREREHLYVQSPTGMGKTIAALFPALKALGQGLAGKIFYLTAKTSGRLVAEKALDDMRAAGLHLKSVTLTAKEKICFCPPVNCDPQVCEFARDYFGKARAAMDELFAYEAFSRPAIEDIARRHRLCPFEFSLDLSLWADCIICDYNYVFDPRVYLHRFFDFDGGEYVFLVDEAHNLPERAREMYSAALEKKAVMELQRALKPHLPALAKKLQVINKILLEVRKTCEQEERVGLVEHEPPQELLKAVRSFGQAAEDWLVQNQDTEFRGQLLDFYFACSGYLRTAEWFDDFYVSYFERQGQNDLRARLFCMDPAPMLADRLEQCRAAVFFSATLLPVDYFMKLITGAQAHPARVFSSPFPPENAALLVYNAVSTSYVRRADSYDAIAGAIEQVVLARAGNYLVFFPSYAYLAQVRERLAERLGEEVLLAQDRGLDEAGREAFLARFAAGDGQTLVGLAVMGGVFGEGIDLVGERLIGALVVGVGVPQVCLERDLIREYFDRQNGNGFAYAYQLPGFNRVLQATGRVIRTESDRGVIVLVDERFTHGRYRTLFPSHWQGWQVVRNTQELAEKLARFWRQGQ